MDQLELTIADQTAGESEDCGARQIGGGARILDAFGETQPENSKQDTAGDWVRIISPSGDEMKKGM